MWESGEEGVWSLAAGRSESHHGGASVVDQSQDHAVQVDEEAEQVVAQFNHGLLHVGLELTPVVDLSGVEHAHVPHGNLHVPINVPGSYRQVEQEDEPVHGDEHEHGGETLTHHLWNHPLVEFGAACSGVDIITLQIRQSDNEVD